MRWPIFLATLFIITLCSLPFAVSDGEPFLVVGRFIHGPNIVHKNMFVTTQIYNTGNSTAYNIKILDSFWKSNNFTNIRFSEIIVDKLEPGQNFTHVTTVVPTKSKLYNAASAIVSYHTESDPTEIFVYSNTPNFGKFRIYRPNEASDDTTYNFEWVTFAVIIVLSVAFPVTSYIQARSKFSKIYLSHRKGRVEKN
ncbi:uncharacterized protein LOC126315332 [Schistocerca gregaria]|uniref:uncharacterized protein LOC126315332 n=1 Tax=Schistocerca gregaria TaxID=7010 RepID=UPI00211E119C|nr:uncharacterized protein LOC126315332 [Schistocerca gregaria]XP_049848541.1 uncharacterized protein LOC126315332 [Schistocerca gregaria]XP_049848542.1 uncharacterized protein LOC126315332 [Schistocerca gregaria]